MPSEDQRWPRQRSLRRVLCVAWPAFLAAIAAEVIFFAVFDPLDFNMRIHLSRQAVYTIGFIAFWALGILSSTLTLLLATPPDRARAGDFVDSGE